MPLETIDWPNITATLAAAAMGGWVAASVAKRQITAALQVERDKAQREAGRELLESIDSYLHIAYRGDGDLRWERQRLRRKIISLTLLTFPQQAASVQEHLDAVDAWWRQQAGGPRVKGVGFTATEQFFNGIKQTLFSEVFGTTVQFTAVTDSSEGGRSS